jgi:hypothetical protein
VEVQKQTSLRIEDRHSHFTLEATTDIGEMKSKHPANALPDAILLRGVRVDRRRGSMAGRAHRGF